MVTSCVTITVLIYGGVGTEATEAEAYLALSRCPSMILRNCSERSLSWVLQGQCPLQLHCGGKSPVPGQGHPVLRVKTANCAPLKTIQCPGKRYQLGSPQDGPVLGDRCQTVLLSWLPRMDTKLCFPLRSPTSAQDEDTKLCSPQVHTVPRAQIPNWAPFKTI